MRHILLEPKITEKSMRAAARGVFTFEVLPHTTKDQIAAAVESMFKVNVVKVTVTARHTAPRRTGSRRLIVPQETKRYASVELKTGQTIALFDLKETN